MSSRSILGTVFTLLLAGQVLRAQSLDSLFVSAQEAYRAGSFGDATAAYELIISEGRTSASIYYNLGNTYFRTGNIPRAILAYERASRLDPTDGDIQHNLGLARLQTIDRIDPLPELFIVTWVRWLNASLPLSVTITIFLAGWCLIFVSLSVMYLVRSSAPVRAMRLTFFGGSALALLFGVLLLFQVFLTPKASAGIIMSPTVTAKSSPDGQNVDAFVVHEGLKVTLGDRVEEWIRITLADGKTGWIRMAEVEPV